jgi:hypothetical protein
MPTKLSIGLIQEVRFAGDSLLEKGGFELVWGFSCQVGCFGFFVSERERPFFVL